MRNVKLKDSWLMWVPIVVLVGSVSLGVLRSDSRAAGIAKLKSTRWVTHTPTSTQSPHKVATYKLSTHKRRITINLPAKSKITSGYELRAKFTYDTRRGTKAITIIIPMNTNLIRKGSGPSSMRSGKSNHGNSVYFLAQREGMRQLTERTDVTIQVFDGKSKKHLYVRFKPYTGPNYVVSIGGPALINGGSAVNFDVYLGEPATQSQTLYWTFNVPSCFSHATNDSPYNPNAFRNQVVYQTGQQVKRLTAIVSNTTGCGGSKQIRTWVGNQNTMQAPEFQSKGFTVRLQ